MIAEQRSSTGSSVPALVKVLVARCAPLDDPSTASKDWTKKVTRALKKLVADGKVVKFKASYKLPGVEFASEEEAGILQEDFKVGEGRSFVVAGCTVKVAYEGRLDNASGAVFDKAANFDFTVGIGEVIKVRCDLLVDRLHPAARETQQQPTRHTHTHEHELDLPHLQQV